MINWFPGHMNKTLKQMQQDSKICDCFIYVLDARCPSSCINPEFIKVVKDKPIIYVLNKADLIDEPTLNRLKAEFARRGECVSINSTISNASKVVITSIHKLFEARLNKNKQNSVNFIIRAMVLGVPNSGKSTLVNNLCKQAIATTGDKAGVTRSKQWVRVDSLIQVLDTPGVLLPNFDDEDKAYNLAFVGSVKDEVLNICDVAVKLIIRLNSIDDTILKNSYKLELNDNNTSLEILNMIGKRRGCVIRGGEIDLERASKILLTDFRAGKLGKIALE